MSEAPFANLKNHPGIMPPAAGGPAGYDELLLRLNLIVGRTIGEIASSAQADITRADLRSRGFFGKIIEKALGASAASRPQPDFPKFGLELKTVSLDDKMQPCDDIFLCQMQQNGIRMLRFEETALFRKIRRMLLVCVRCPDEAHPVSAIVTGYIFWQPDSNVLQAIRKEWEDLMETLRIDSKGSCGITGDILLLRVKGADSTVRVHAEESCVQQRIRTDKRSQPKSIYLRRAFAAGILAQAAQADSGS